MAFRARYYDIHTARFISEDPVGLASGPNSYEYAANSPVRFGDPLGLYPGQMPPAPPGYDPATWPSGQFDNGRQWIDSPTGTRWIAHPEDDAHWRHWDLQDPDGGNQKRFPDNSLKPRPNQKKLPKDRCETDPNGDEPGWEPPTKQPRGVPDGIPRNGLPFIPLPLLPLPTLPFPFPFPMPMPMPVPVFVP